VGGALDEEGVKSGVFKGLVEINPRPWLTVGGGKIRTGRFFKGRPKRHNHLVK